MVKNISMTLHTESNNGDKYLDSETFTILVDGRLNPELEWIPNDGLKITKIEIRGY